MISKEKLCEQTLLYNFWLLKKRLILTEPNEEITTFIFKNLYYSLILTPSAEKIIPVFIQIQFFYNILSLV